MDFRAPKKGNYAVRVERRAARVRRCFCEYTRRRRARALRHSGVVVLLLLTGVFTDLVVVSFAPAFVSFVLLSVTVDSTPGTRLSCVSTRSARARASASLSPSLPAVAR